MNNEQYLFKINETVVNVNGRLGRITKRYMKVNNETKKVENYYKVDVGTEKDIYGAEKSYTSVETEEMQCVICFEDVICAKFFKCRHKICSGCYSQLSPRRCYARCGCEI